MDVLPLIKCLSDGGFHSGESLGRALSISRTAIWKQIQKLEELGLAVESIKGRGYRLIDGVDLLDAAEIERQITPAASNLLGELYIQQVVDSTSRFLMSQQEVGGGAAVCLAERQTAGRGRRGRRWVSPYGRNVYFSCRWFFDEGVAAVEGLSLAVGAALVDALESFGVSGVGLKWPNDLLWQGRKVAGILLELNGDAAGRCAVVIGIGLNANMPQQCGREIEQPWVDMATLAKACGVTPPSRNQLVAALLNRLLPMLSTYQERGFAAQRARWLELDCYRGQPVQLSVGSVVHRGVARGVDQNGALLLESDGEIRAYSGGELTLRPLRHGD